MTEALFNYLRNLPELAEVSDEDVRAFAIGFAAVFATRRR